MICFFINLTWEKTWDFDFLSIHSHSEWVAVGNKYFILFYSNKVP